jgi:hypothetical protein
MQQIKKILLHWSGTPYKYSGFEPNGGPAYHHLFGQHGETILKVDYHTPLMGHTFRRNSNAVALSCACMGGAGFDEYPPTHDQIDAMCKAAAKIAYSLGWPTDAKKLESLIMTHAEAAANRDYPIELALKDPGHDNDAGAEEIGLPHSNYGPSNWKGAPVNPTWPGGTVWRWDWWYCHKEDERKGGIGGYELRDRIVYWMKQFRSEEKK